jgi:hypothetical protein
MLHCIHTLDTGLMHFCRPVILCANRLLKFPAGLSHSFQSLIQYFRACNFMCQPFTHCVGLLPSLQICPLASLQTSLLSSVQACYPQVCLLGSLYAGYPLCKPVYPFFKLFSLFRPILYPSYIPVILRAGLPVVPAVNSAELREKQ